MSEFSRITIYKLELVILLFFLGMLTITSTGTQIIGDKLVLTCTISPFNSPTTWSQDGVIRTTCTSSVCTDYNYGNYTTFSYGSNYIDVTFDPVHSSIDGVWQCTHATFGNDNVDVTAMNETLSKYSPIN